MNILLIAYACEPNKGSEPGVGWNWAVHLSKYVNVTVVTRANNRASIEAELKDNNNDLSFLYYDSQLLKKFKKISPFFLKLYYFFWVYVVGQFIKKNISLKEISIIHFITFNTFLIPPRISKLGAKTIWGPIGGGVKSYPELFRNISFKAYLKENFRNIYVELFSKYFLLRKTKTKYSKLIFANSDTAKLLKEEYPLIELETGINKIKYSNRSTSNVNKIIVLSSGILEPRKGFHLLIDAGSLIKPNITINILGRGYLKSQLIKRRNEAAIDNIHFLGFVDFRDIDKFYNSSDIFVFPSLRDTSGNVVLEAMSRGLPVIAFDHQGMHDILTEECAIKIPVTNYSDMIENLADAINYLSENPEIRLRMGQASLQRIKDLYLWEAKATRMVQFYKEVLNENSSSS